MVNRRKIKLPAVTEEYLKLPGSTKTGKFVRAFHRWLRDRRLSLSDINPDHVTKFIENPSGTKLGNYGRNDYRCVIRRYIDWLYMHGVIDFSGKQIYSRRQPLPAIAEDFLKSLKPTRRPSTCTSYRIALKKFYDWLKENDLDIHTIDRQQMKSWFEHLYDCGQSPATRVNMIVQVRVYLRGLYEQGDIHQDADYLIRKHDMPKRPQYLPRPLPPDADKILCKRLAASKCQYKLGLLLMRNTGLRLGELQSLEVDCVRYDDKNRAYLKVPLGKMYNERLVPLDDKTLKIIRQLRKRGASNKTWLIESVTGRKTQQQPFSTALKEACEGIEIPNPVTTHRLRHTYATTLMNAGMSLAGIMKLLGHRDYRMTLRYTYIADETMGREYFEALAQIEKLYDWTRPDFDAKDPQTPVQLLDDVIHWLRAQPSGDKRRKKTTKRLIRRLERTREEILSMKLLKPKKP